MQTSLNITNVLLNIVDPKCYWKLAPDANESESNTPFVGSRDWRKLRDRFVSFLYSDSGAEQTEDERMRDLARWLDDVGYLTEDGRRFTAELITDKIYSFFLREWSRMIQFAMTQLNPHEAPTIFSVFQRYQRRTDIAKKGGRKPNPLEAFAEIGYADYFVDFDPRREINVDMRVVETLFAGMGTLKALSSRFHVDQFSRPIVDLEANSPMHAISLSVFIDRVFTQQEMAVCKWQGGRPHQFIKRKTNQRFCQEAHYTLWKMRLLRTKERYVKNAVEAARNKKDWAWIARRATRQLKKEYPDEPKKVVSISPEWASGKRKNTGKGN